MYKKINKCRVCGNPNLEKIIDLGVQKLTGIFPLPGEHVDEMPMEVVRCAGEFPNVCNLIQLSNTFNLNSMYGDTYGYRSGLNLSMVNHLNGIVDQAVQLVGLQDGDLILDIGSNDSTLLQRYKTHSNSLNLVGIDPTGTKFKDMYPEDIKLIPEFFGTEEVTKKLGTKKAKIITSISCFYDLEDPIAFAKEVAKSLDVNGLWIFEQAYTPASITTNGFDVICAEHLLFYSLQQIQFILERAGLTIYDVSFNSCNGGSFRVFAGSELSSKWGPVNKDKIEKVLEDERGFYSDPDLFKKFNENIEKEKDKLLEFLNESKTQGKLVVGLGASTKGNVLLQHFGITSELLPFIAEVNEFKFGKVTPGTNIPIISELEASKLNPDFYLILPWHFKTTFTSKFKTFLEQGGKLVFPLPNFEIVS